MPRFTKTQVIARSLAMSIIMGLILLPIAYFLLYGKVSLIEYTVDNLEGLTVGDINCYQKFLDLPSGASFLLSGRKCNIIKSKINHSTPIDVTVYRATRSDETMIRTLYINGSAIISEEASEEQRWVVVFGCSIPFVACIGAMIFIFFFIRRELAAQ
ncbi:hypothetical protein [Aeromonas allosaccharophila]|uniref:hypothetical protein n=1 Tax=Aeromonas allosaccharophila TaxID=656 RepID=UPI0035BC753A